MATRKFSVRTGIETEQLNAMATRIAEQFMVSIPAEVQTDTLKTELARCVKHFIAFKSEHAIYNAKEQAWDTLAEKGYTEIEFSHFQLYYFGTKIFIPKNHYINDYMKSLRTESSLDADVLTLSDAVEWDMFASLRDWFIEHHIEDSIPCGEP